MKYLRYLGYSILGAGTTLLILISGAYALLRNERLLVTLVLPRVEKLLDIPIKVDSIAFDPLSKLSATGVTIGPSENLLFSVQEIKARFRPRALLSGLVEIESLKLNRPFFRLSGSADESAERAEESQASFAIRIRNAAVEHGDLKISWPNGGVSLADLSFRANEFATALAEGDSYSDITLESVETSHGALLLNWPGSSLSISDFLLRLGQFVMTSDDDGALSSLQLQSAALDDGIAQLNWQNGSLSFDDLALKVNLFHAATNDQGTLSNLRIESAAVNEADAQLSWPDSSMSSSDLVLEISDFRANEKQGDPLSDIRIEDAAIGQGTFRMSWPQSSLTLDQLRLKIEKFIRGGGIEVSGSGRAAYSHKRDGEVRAASVSLTTQGAFADSFSLRELSGHALVAGISGQLNDRRFDEQSAAVQWNIQPQDNWSSVNIRQISLEATNQQDKSLQINGSGSVSLDGGSGTLDISDFFVSTPPLEAAIPELQAVPNTSAEGSLKVSFNQSGVTELAADATVATVPHVEAASQDQATLKFSYLQAQGTHHLQNTAIHITSQGQSVIDAKGSASLHPPQSEHRSLVDLSITELHPQRLSSFLERYLPTQERPGNQRDVNPKNVRAQLNRIHGYIAEKPFSDLTAAITIGRLNTESVELREISGNFLVESHHVQLQNLRMILDDAPPLQLEAALQFANGDTPPSHDSRLATLNLDVRDLRLPYSLSNVPPFNILFVPFTVLSNINTILPVSILPSPVAGISSKISDVLHERGRLFIDEGTASVVFQNSQAEVPEVEFDSGLISKVYFAGEVGYDRSINLRTSMKLAGLRIPLPIGGTLDRPVPNLAVFGPELLKSAGLSVTELPFEVIDQLTRLNPLSPLLAGKSPKSTPVPIDPPNIISAERGD